MYISKLMMKNFKNFEEFSVDFKDGANLIIGQNNTGKSNILKALAILFDGSAKKRLLIDDFYVNIPLEDLKQHSPKVSITAILTQSKDEDLMGDELVTVSNWLTSLGEPYSAQIQYEFFLPEAHEIEYKTTMEKALVGSEARSIIENNYLRLYISKTWVGNPDNQIQVDSESLSKFDFQFLDAIRDVERDMFSGKNTLLKDVIDFFMDYDIKSNKELTEEQQSEQIESRKKDFKDIANPLIKNLHGRLDSGKTEILSYAQNVGALFDKSSPDFEGKVTENELYSILKLIVKQTTGMSLPITHNGLGYNNLIFMSLLLAKMQVDSDGKYLGSNAKVFPILAIEEPEAHLHPTMQFQLIKFLKQNITDKKVKQVFITSHSTHITSSAQLDDIICLYKNGQETKVAYPGRVFYDVNEDGTKIEKPHSKKYVQRFLDATKSNMLFAERIIFVEGLAEQLLISVFADYLGKPLEENHISVINVGGRYFDHFLYLFDCNKNHTIRRKIACLADLDPVRKEKKADNAKFKKCYPFELHISPEEYDYEVNSMEKYDEGKHPTIRAFLQESGYGKTLEYQLAFENATNSLLITPSMQNADELAVLIKKVEEDKPLSELLASLKNSKENSRIKEIAAVESEAWADDIKKKAVVASRYLNSVEKGENALELASILKENFLNKGTKEYKDFNVPDYIKSAIEWVCGDK